MTTITGSDIPKYRLLVLRSSLGLELKGMHRRGRSAYSIIKEELSFKGNRQKVWDQLDKHIADMTCPHCHKWMPDESFRRALSRKDNETEICPDCGVKEAMEGVLT